MFGLGNFDNCLFSYLTTIFGFEFESKIVPGGARLFVQQFSMFLFLGCLAIWPMETKADYRIFFITFLLLGIISELIIINISKGFKKSKRELDEERTIQEEADRLAK